MKKRRICAECNGRGVAKKVVMDIDNGNGTRTAIFGDVRCINCAGTGIVHEAISNFDLFMELNAEELGKLIAKHIPSRACPEEVRKIWFSFPPSMKNDAYEKAWVEFLLSPAKGPLK